MASRNNIFSPFWLPIIFFSGTILLGSLLLWAGPSAAQGHISWLDALFTATSATCVTGLVVVDTGSFFGLFGQSVIMFLMQVGGLGIMTYTTLVLYLIRHRITMHDRMAVGQSLLHDPAFNLAGFISRVVIGTLVVELVGGLILYGLDGAYFTPFSAAFHAISAFCNAGFALFPENLAPWSNNPGVNLVFMVLIVLGGLGFYVLHDCYSYLKSKLIKNSRLPVQRPARLSWHSKIVLSTSLFLIVGGAVAMFLAEIEGGAPWGDWHLKLLASFFQSITCRTAGFNTVEISHLTNVTLVFMVFLMFVGGSPGSCAGGIKTTTLRALWGFAASQVLGRRQTKVGSHALRRDTLQQALTLTFFASVLIALGCLILNMTEGGDTPHLQARGLFLEVLFEVVSAFSTVGLSMGLTAKLTPTGKVVIIILMFVGRIGPIWILSALQSWQRDPHYRVPEAGLPLG